MSGRFLSFCSHLPSVVVCVILLAARGALAQPEQPPSDGTAGSEPVDQAAVVPPKLVKFQDATYPPEARRLGLTADVILRLTIDDTGAVTDAEVVQAAGHGFGIAPAVITVDPDVIGYRRQWQGIRQRETAEGSTYSDDPGTDVVDGRLRLGPGLGNNRFAHRDIGADLGG